jgi:Dyp-type peroxidase family
MAAKSHRSSTKGERVTQGATTMLEVNDIQSGVLRPRPPSYAGTYMVFRIDDQATGHEMLKRLTPAVASAADATSPAGDAWVMVALSYHGLKALGVPPASLESFSPEFQQGMAARAAELGDVGESGPDHWERPFGTSDVHLAITAIAPDRTRLEQVLERARQAAYRGMSRNGSYVAFRKLHQDVAAFSRYLAAHSTSTEEEEWLAAKMVGRWRSGAPLTLSPEHDNPELGADPKRHNDFLYYDDDPKGFKCPPGSHIRRLNPRDQFKHEAVQVNRHRLLRRGLAYGPLLPEGVRQDDGAERGIFFIFIGASLSRQFEFVQSEWVNQGIFIGAPGEKDPMSGSNDGTGVFTIPKQPIRQRLQGLPQFVTNRGGEYFFLPGMRALQWLADAR